MMGGIGLPWAIPNVVGINAAALYPAVKITLAPKVNVCVAFVRALECPF